MNDITGNMFIVACKQRCNFFNSLEIRGAGSKRDCAVVLKFLS